MIDKCYNINCDIYSCNIILHIGKSQYAPKSFRKFLSKKFGKDCNQICDDIYRYVGSPENDSDDWCMDCLDNKGKQKIIINIKEFSITNIDNIGSISHECNHAALFILGKRGVENDKVGWEALVYLQEFLMTEFIKKIQKERSKKNDY